MALMVRLHKLLSDRAGDNCYAAMLRRGAGEVMGGLAQALGVRPLLNDFGLGIVQFHRALRGAAFAHGASFRSAPTDCSTKSYSKNCVWKSTSCRRVSTPNWDAGERIATARSRLTPSAKMTCSARRFAKRFRHVVVFDNVSYNG